MFRVALSREIAAGPQNKKINEIKIEKNSVKCNKNSV